LQLKRHLSDCPWARSAMLGRRELARLGACAATHGATGGHTRGRVAALTAPLCRRWAACSGLSEHVRQPSAAIAAASREQYAADGAVVLRGVISEAWLKHLRGAAEEALARPGPQAEQLAKPPGFYFSDLELAERLEPFRRFALDGPCGAIAGEVMGSSEVCFLYDQYFHQRYEAGDATNAVVKTPWHQDQPYWSVDGTDVCSVWVPLDPVPLESAVSFLAGSNRWGMFSPRHFATGKSYEGTGMPAVPSLDGHERLAWSTEPGDVIVFAGMTFHGQEDARRVQGQFRRLSVRYTGDDARFCRRSGEAADVIPSKYHPCDLQPGDPMRCARFPQVWQRPAA